MLSMPRQWMRQAVASGLLCLLSFQYASAGTGQFVTLPFDQNKKVKNGIVATVDTRWTDGRGYRPVTVTLTSRKIQADRRITVRLYPGSYSTYNNGLEYEFELEIPQGKRDASKTVYLRQDREWNYFRAEFYEGGRKLKDISQDSSQYYSNQYNQGSPTVLLVDRDVPRISDNRIQILTDLKARTQTTDKDGKLIVNASYDYPGAEKVAFLAATNNRSTVVTRQSLDKMRRGMDLDSLEFVQTAANLEMIPPLDLPTASQGLAGVDIIVVPSSELQEIQEKHPARFRALDYFVRDGGNLIVFGDDDVFGFVEQVLSLSREWQTGHTGAIHATETSFHELSQTDTSVRQRPVKKIAGTPLDELAEFKFAAHGFGRVIAIDAADAYELPVGYWQWILRTIGTRRLTWDDRMGIATRGDNSSFWKFMIPGFGKAPVKSFLFTISVFFLVIGPANFYFLKKAKRLYLLPLTVGIAALITTVSMLGYAIVSDGIATRVRLRSLTVLDQSSDQTIAASHCRHSYVAAFAPSGGLVFPGTTSTYPIHPFGSYNRRYSEKQGARTGRKSLTAGYLRPRSTSQLLTTDVVETEHQVAVTQAADGNISSIVNQLGVTAKHAWFCDGGGRLHQGSETLADQPFATTTIDKETATKLFNKLLGEHRPARPKGMDQPVNRSFWDFGQRVNYGGGPSYGSSIMEREISALRRFFSAPKPNTFLVISTDAPPFIAQGVEAIEEAGFHAIRGNW